MHDTYNAETVEMIVNMTKEMHNKTTWNKIIFSARFDSWCNQFYQNREQYIMQ